MEKKTLSELYPKWMENEGIFDMFVNPPWDNQATADDLNLEYFGNHSGSKLASPFAIKMLDDDDSYSATIRGVISRVIQRKFKTKWEKLWATEVASYNPLDTYSMTESRATNRNTSANENTDRDISYGGYETDSVMDSSTTTHGKTETTTDSVYGYNSSLPSPSSKSEYVEGGTTGDSRTSTDRRDRSLTEAEDVARTKQEAVGETESITKTGNSGLHAKQDLLKKERELRMWNFFDQVYKDIDEVMTICVYDLCKI